MHSQQVKGTYPTRLSYTRFICTNFKAVQILHQCTLAEKVLSHKNLDEKFTLL